MRYLILSLLFVIFSSNLTYAQASDSLSYTYYAKATANNVFFYQSATEDAPLFEIPKSYFVLLIDDANDDFYKAIYGELTGYVKKEEVVAMNGTPQTPYATVHNIRITSMSGLSLQSQATFESTPITTLDFLESNIVYYGKLSGQEYFPNSSKTWYYCSFNENSKANFGYLFSYYCDLPSSIKPNEEYFEEITEKLIFKKPLLKSNGLSDTVKALIVLSVVIPSLLCLYFFLMPKKAKSKKIIRRKKDYYELNENDLN